MFCARCGNEIKNDARFCVRCGAPVEDIPAATILAGNILVSNASPGSIPKGSCFDGGGSVHGNQQEATLGNRKTNNPHRPSDAQMMQQGQKISNQITLCEDGKYRWIYEMNLYTNPTVFFLVWKIFFFIILGMFSIMMIVDATSWDDFFPDMLIQNLKFFGYFCIGMTVLVGVSCLIYAMQMGGKYIVQFEMDEQGINHKQIDYQAVKAKKLGKLTTAAGLASGSLTTAGIGMNATRTEMYTDFGTTRKVKCYPFRCLIKVNGLLSHNQVYTAREDFEFVKNYILTHCPNLKG